MTKPLDRVVILDVTTFLSGPYCTLLLAGLGAEVIKVEQPQVGDPSRNSPPFAGPQGAGAQALSPKDMSFGFLKRSRNKKSVTLNLKHEKGKEIFKDLAAKADIVVENFRPGTMSKLGIGYEQLKTINPSLIYCSLSGFGLSGAKSNLPAFDIVVQAMSGLMSINGAPESQPIKTGVTLGDLSGGMFSCIGILAALQYRNVTGKGQLVETSMLDSLLALMLDEAPDYWSSQGQSIRMGNQLPRLSPFNSYPTMDGYLVIASGNDSHWERILKAIDRSDLIGDPRFQTQAMRTTNINEVDKIIISWTSRQTTSQAVEVLIKNEVPCGPVRDVRDVIKDEELKERGSIVDLHHPDVGKIGDFKAWGFPIKFSEASTGFTTPAPKLGANNEEIYSQFLGLTLDQLKALKAEKVI